MSSNGGTKKKQQRKKRVNEDEEDEVEKLLRATEDDIMLKLSVDSHISRGSSSQIIHPDLDRRFQALRSSSKPPVAAAAAAATTTRSDVKPNQSSVSVDVNDDDLFARFAALKSSLPSHADRRIEQVAKNDDDYNEVDEIIRWAIDAAALDPSRSDDEDDVDDSSEEVSDGDDDDDDDEDSTEEKDKKKKKKSTSNITKMK